LLSRPQLLPLRLLTSSRARIHSFSDNHDAQRLGVEQKKLDQVLHIMKLMLNPGTKVRRTFDSESTRQLHARRHVLCCFAASILAVVPAF
jgi:hypothetical protein